MLRCQEILNLGKTSLEIPTDYKEGILYKGLAYINEVNEEIRELPEGQQYLPMCFSNIVQILFFQNLEDIFSINERIQKNLMRAVQAFLAEPIQSNDHLKTEILACLLYNIVMTSNGITEPSDFKKLMENCFRFIEIFETIDQRSSLRVLLSYFAFAKVNFYQGELSKAKEVLEHCIANLDKSISMKDEVLFSLVIAPKLHYAYLLKKLGKNKESLNVVRKLLKSLSYLSETAPYLVVAALNECREGILSLGSAEMWNEISSYQIKLIRENPEDFKQTDLAYQLLLKTVNLYHLNQFEEAAEVLKEYEDILLNLEDADQFVKIRAAHLHQLTVAYLLEANARKIEDEKEREEKLLLACKMLYKLWSSQSFAGIQAMLCAKILAISRMVQNPTINAIAINVREYNKELVQKLEEMKQFLPHVESIPEEAYYPSWGAKVQ